MTVVVRGTGGKTGFDKLHPMGKGHWIESIWVEDQAGNVVGMVEYPEPTGAETTKFIPVLKFTLPKGTTVTSLTPFEFCNKHGLWAGPKITVPFKSVGIVARDKTKDLTVTSGPNSYHKPSIRPYDVATNEGKHHPVVLHAATGADGSIIVTVVVRGTGGKTGLGALHPMGKGHWIESIWVEDQTGNVVGMVEYPEPTGAETTKYLPVLKFTLPKGTDVTSLTPYEYCNLHGLWAGPKITVPFKSVGVVARDKTKDLTVTSGPNSYHKPSIRPYDVATNEGKHHPVVLHAATGADGSIIVTVVVRGTGGKTGLGALHPMGKGHWIESIWVEDQTGNVVGMVEYPEPTGAETTKYLPVLKFTLPKGTDVTSLTPYEYCNLHGLWVGPKVAVSFGKRVMAVAGVVNETIPSGPNSWHINKDANNVTKHDPAITSVFKNADDSVTVTMVVRGTGGNTALDKLHPMGKGHYIESMWVSDEAGNVLHMVDYPEPTGTEAKPYLPVLRFTIPAGSTAKTLTPYEYCNLHGLWQGTTLSITGSATNTPPPPLTLGGGADANTGGAVAGSDGWIQALADTRVKWAVSGTKVTFTVEVSGLTWCGVAVSKEGQMVDPVPSEAVIGGTWGVTRRTLMYQDPSDIKDMAASEQDALTASSWTQDAVAKKTTMQFTMTLAALEKWADANGNTWMLVAHGEKNEFAYHGVNKKFFKANFRKGSGDTVVKAPTGDTCEVSSADMYSSAKCYYQTATNRALDYGNVSMGYDHTKQLTNGYQVSWSIKRGKDCALAPDPYDPMLCGEIHVSIQGETLGWLGLGIMDETMNHGMLNTDMWWGYVDDTTGEASVTDRWSVGILPPIEDIRRKDGKADIFGVAGFQNASTGVTTVMFKRALYTGDSSDHAIRMGKIGIVYAFNRMGSDKIDSYHGPTRGYANLDLNQDRVVTNMNYYPQGAKDFVHAIAIVTIIMCVALMGWVVGKRTHPEIRVAQPYFLVFILIGSILQACSLFAFAVDDSVGSAADVNVACVLEPWLYELGFCLTYGCLIVKTWRIKALFELAVKTKTSQRVAVSPFMLVRGIGGFIGLTSLVCAIWTGIDPLEWTRKVTARNEDNFPLNSIGGCGSKEPFIFVGILGLSQLACYLYGVMILYQARNLHTRFSEGKYITMCMVSNVQIFVLTIPFLFISATNPTALMLVKSGSVFMNNMTVLVLIFGPKLYTVSLRSSESLEAEQAVAARTMVADFQTQLNRTTDAARTTTGEDSDAGKKKKKTAKVTPANNDTGGTTE